MDLTHKIFCCNFIKNNIMSENTETPKTISVRMVEYYNTMLVKEPVEINVEDYSELNGMTEEEMQEYISENWENMKPTNDEWYESLWEECNQAEIIREKITNNEFECNFE